MADISEAMVEAAKDAALREGAFLGEDMVRYMLEAALSAAPASAQMEGMVLVPREPSDPEVQAALDAYWQSVERGHGTMSRSFTTNHSMRAALAGSRKFLAARALRESLQTAEGETP